MAVGGGTETGADSRGGALSPPGVVDRTGAARPGVDSRGLPGAESRGTEGELAVAAETARIIVEPA